MSKKAIRCCSMAVTITCQMLVSPKSNASTTGFNPKCSRKKQCPRQQTLGVIRHQFQTGEKKDLCTRLIRNPLRGSIKIFHRPCLRSWWVIRVGFDWRSQVSYSRNYLPHSSLALQGNGGRMMASFCYIWPKIRTGMIVFG